MRRRIYLCGVVGATIPLAGCGGLFRPDPEVVAADAEQSLTGAITGSVDIELELVNHGREGDVQITFIFEDEDSVVVGRERFTITMGEDERRRETFTVDVPSGTEQYKVEASAA